MRYLDPRDPGIIGPVIEGEQAATKAVTVPNGDAAKGAWSSVFSWPLIGIHAVMTPTGKLLTYGTRTNGQQGAGFHYDVWDPSIGIGADSHTTLPNTTAVDAFCSSQMLLTRGDVQLFGGDVDINGNTTNTPNQDTLLFKPSNNSLTKIGRLQRPRWYSSAVMLPTGDVMIQGGTGGNDRPEIRGTDGTQRLLTGANTSGLASTYPKNFVGPDGLVFGIADNQMYRIDPSGNGTLTSLGALAGNARGSSATSAVYEPGKVMLIGGGSGSYATNEVKLVDFRAATPVVTNAAPMTYPRHLANASVMADGKVVVVGGSYGYNADNGVAYNAEIYDPKTNRWTVGAAQKQMRLYHSNSVLLPDATVLSLGGGAPSPQTNLNGEIYFPPYLYKADGTPAKRPVISWAPTVIEPTGSFIIQSPEAASATRITLVKTTSATHSHNMDQRFVELVFSRSGTDLIATLPANSNDLPPGYYMVFLFDAAGVPSVAKIMRVNAAPAAARALSIAAAAVPGGPVMLREFSGNAWKTWANIGGTPARAPYVANDPSGEWFAVYTHEASGRILRRYRNAGTLSATWEDTGLEGYWPPAAASWRGQAWLAWIDWFHGIRVRPFDPVNGVGMTWELGGDFVEAPTLVRGGDGLLYVLGRATAGQVQYRAFNGGYWTAWATLGGFPAGHLAATAIPGGIQVFIRGTDSSGWSIGLKSGTPDPQWAWLGGNLISAPRAAWGGTSPVVASVTQGGASVLGTMSNGAFSGWLSAEGTALEMQSAVSAVNNDLELTVQTAGNQLWSRQRAGGSNTWGTWTRVY